MSTTLNPPKTPLHSNKISAPKLSFSSSFSSFGTKPNSSKSNSYPRISLSVMSNKNQNQNQNHHHHQQYLSLDAVISSNRKAELLGDIKGSLSNRLSETNLHLTVPGLKSKTRGKVLCDYSSLKLFSLFIWIKYIFFFLLEDGKWDEIKIVLCRWEIFMMAGIILFWWQRTAKVRSIEFLLLFPSKARLV